MPQVITVGPQTSHSADGVAMPIWVKDPDDVKDYTLDVTNELTPGDAVAAVTFIVAPASELTVLSSNFANNATVTLIDANGDETTLTNRSIVTCWLQAGVLDLSYGVTARVITENGEQFDRTFQITIGEN